MASPGSAGREAATEPILTVEGFAKRFFLHEQGKAIPSAAEVNLTVHPGRLTALVGPTGAGKSTVLKAVYRSYLTSAGRILYRCADGREVDLARVDEHRVLELRRREIAFVTQFLHAPPRQAALDVVARPLIQGGVGREQGRRRAAEVLAALKLPERLWGTSPATFSGGERQRVNLARGIVARPRLLLLDEPTASLDPDTTDTVLALLRGLKAEGTGMLAVFHQPQLVARIADRVVTLARPAPI